MQFNLRAVKDEAGRQRSIFDLYSEASNKGRFTRKYELAEVSTPVGTSATCTEHPLLINNLDVSIEGDGVHVDDNSTPASQLSSKFSIHETNDSLRVLHLSVVRVLISPRWSC